VTLLLQSQACCCLGWLVGLVLCSLLMLLLVGILLLLLPLQGQQHVLG
jgi:hypothetical protein